MSHLLPRPKKRVPPSPLTIQGLDNNTYSKIQQRKAGIASKYNRRNINSPRARSKGTKPSEPDTTTCETQYQDRWSSANVMKEHLLQIENERIKEIETRESRVEFGIEWMNCLTCDVHTEEYCSQCWARITELL